MKVIKHTVGIESIAISIEDSARAGESSRGRVSVGIVVGTGRVDTRSVCVLVKGGSGHILGVAGAANDWESSVVQVAVDNNVVAGEGVGKHVGAASTVHVRAVLVGGTRGGGRALSGDSTEASGDSATSRG